MYEIEKPYLMSILNYCISVDFSKHKDQYRCFCKISIPLI